MMFWQWRVVMFLAVGLTLGCSGGSDDSSSSSDSDNSDAPDTNSLEVGSADTVIDVAQSALSSTNFGATEVSSAETIETNLTEEGNATQSDNDSLCSIHGDPWDPDINGPLSDSDGEYAARVFYCAVAGNVIESSDTIAGFLTQQKSIFCTIENHFDITADDYTSEGNELLSDGNQSVSLTTDCWPQGLPDGITEIPFSSTKLTALDESSGWQYEISIASPSISGTVVRFFNKDGVIGFRNTSGGNAPGVGSDTSVIVDTNNGVLLVNEYEDRNGSGGADSAYRGVTRLRVKGTLAKDFSFTEITEGRGYRMISGPGFSAESNDEFVYSTYTASGDSTAGFKFSRWAVQTDGELPELQGDATCDGGDGSCSTAGDIGTAAEMDAQARRPAATKSGWESYIASGFPMCEPESDGADQITYDPAPTSTGKLGKCE